MNELQYTIKQNEKSIMNQYGDMEKEMLRVRKMIEQKDWHGVGEAMVQGFFAKEATKMAGLVGRQQALVEVCGMDFSLEGQE